MPASSAQGSESTNDWEVISAYSRRQAIEDGVLVDVSEAAGEVGFTYPVAMTAAAWVETVERDGTSGAGQDDRGRLHDVLWAAALAARQPPTATDRIAFNVTRVPDRTGRQDAEQVELYAVCGPGDQGEPVITVLAVGED